MKSFSVALCLSLAACGHNTCPPFPAAGPDVAEELETIPVEGYEDFWGWVARLEKMKRQSEN